MLKSNISHFTISLYLLLLGDLNYAMDEFIAVAYHSLFYGISWWCPSNTSAGTLCVSDNLYGDS